MQVRGVLFVDTSDVVVPFLFLKNSLEDNFITNTAEFCSNGHE